MNGPLGTPGTGDLVVDGGSMRYRRFVALGDSCAEGIDDPYPGGRGYRGWADRTAERLAVREPGLCYANLAVRGRRLDQILVEQVPVAVAARPDLAALFGGGNDVLWGRWDPGRTAANLDQAVAALSAVARTVVLFTLPDIARRLPGARWLRPRVDRLNDLIVAVAGLRGAVLVDVREDPLAEDPRLYSVDRLHLGELGHRRVAGHVLTALGASAGDLLGPLPPAEPEPRRRAVAGRWEWLRHHVAPVVRSSVRQRFLGARPGDGFPPKRPELVPFVPSSVD